MNWQCCESPLKYWIQTSTTTKEALSVFLCCLDLQATVSQPPHRAATEVDLENFSKLSCVLNPIVHAANGTQMASGTKGLDIQCLTRPFAVCTLKPICTAVKCTSSGPTTICHLFQLQVKGRCIAYRHQSKLTNYLLFWDQSVICPNLRCFTLFPGSRVLHKTCCQVGHKNKYEMYKNNTFLLCKSHSKINEHDHTNIHTVACFPFQRFWSQARDREKVVYPLASHFS